MSIPLYLLTGFSKRDAAAPEAALKFFLVGTVSSAIIAFGMSYMYGVTGSTSFAAMPPAIIAGDPLMLLGMALLLAGLGGLARRRLAAGRSPVLRWAGYEVALMAVTLGLAAVLSQTIPPA